MLPTNGQRKALIQSLAKELSADLNITVEIVTGEVVDLIYQIRQLEYFGDPYWVRNYRQKADHNAKMVIDTIIRNTKIGDKFIAHLQKAEKLSLETAIKKLEEIAPLAKNPKARTATALASTADQSAGPKPIGASATATAPAAAIPASAPPPPTAAAAAGGGGGGRRRSNHDIAHWNWNKLQHSGRPN